MAGGYAPFAATVNQQSRATAGARGRVIQEAIPLDAATGEAVIA